jgi:MYXO-CTERM domain-containing protein
MHFSRQRLAFAAVGAVFLSCAMPAAATTPASVVVQSSDLGAVGPAFSTGFNLTLAPLKDGDGAAEYFLSDYGFRLASPASFSGAALSFDLGATFQISGLTLTLLQGAPWAGAVPSTLSAGQVADLGARTLFAGSGDATTQRLAAVTLAPGNYTLEVRGEATGSAGGSFAGVLNVAAVPEPAGFALALSGLGLIAVARRRRG